MILIISIYCIKAKKRGLQYTKRILPPFVIPECNIILEYVLKYIALYPDGSIDYEAAGIILGTLDNRTIHRHIELARKMIASTNLHLCEVFSSLSSYAHLPEEKTGEIDEVILTISKWIGKEYIKGGCLEGKDIKNTRIPQNYGINNLEEIIVMVKVDLQFEVEKI